jgi:hypothetical protein
MVLNVGLKPVIPQNAAGLRTEPLVSEPIAPSVNPAATAAAAPLDEPPVKCSAFQGLLRGRPWQIP